MSCVLKVFSAAHFLQISTSVSAKLNVGGNDDMVMVLLFLLMLVLLLKEASFADQLFSREEPLEVL